MIERPARVIAIHADAMQVEVDTASACGHCNSKKNCHGEHTGKVFSLPLEPGVQAGDEVTLSLTESSLNISALLAYLLPVLALILGAQLGDYAGKWLGHNDALAISGAALGLAGGLLVARHLARLFSHDALKPNVEACLQPSVFSTGSST